MNDTYLVLGGMALIVVLAAILLGRRLEASIGSVHLELKPNGGESFRDVVDKRFAALERHLKRLEQRITNHEQGAAALEVVSERGAAKKRSRKAR